MSEGPICGVLLRRPEFRRSPDQRCTVRVENEGEFCWQHDPRNPPPKCGAPTKDGGRCGKLVKHPSLKCDYHRPDAEFRLLSRRPERPVSMTWWSVREFKQAGMVADGLMALGGSDADA